MTLKDQALRSATEVDRVAAALTHNVHTDSATIMELSRIATELHTAATLHRESGITGEIEVIEVTFSFIKPAERIRQNWPAVPRVGERIKLDDDHMGAVESVWWHVVAGVVYAIVEVVR